MKGYPAELNVQNQRKLDELKRYCSDRVIKEPVLEYAITCRNCSYSLSDILNYTALAPTKDNELGATLPLYSKAYLYALLPDAISLNEIIDAFNVVEKDSQVGSDIWQSDDVLGWMYESYNNVKKKAHKDSGDKTEYNKVSLQSQVYTPRWVVQFLVENSLGKLYLGMYSDSEIKRCYKVANVGKKPQMNTDGHGLEKEIICENLCPSVVKKDLR